MSALAVVSGGLGQPSSTRLLADRLEAAVRAQLDTDGQLTTATVIELRPLGHAIVDAMLTGFPSTELRAAFDAIDAADGLIAVTPAFNASYGGLFKSFFDVLPEDTLADMPALIAATGGTDRHSLVLEHALRPMFSYLHAVVSPIGVYAATDDFGAGGQGAALGERIEHAARDFARMLRSCAPRQRHAAADQNLATMQQALHALNQPPATGR